jgi:hypothetical protein
MATQDESVLMQKTLKRMARLVKMRAKRFNTPLIYSENGAIVSYDVRKKQKTILYARTKV